MSSSSATLIARADVTGRSVSERAVTVRWIVRLRWGSVIAESATVILALAILHMPLATTALATIIAVTAVSNLALDLWRRAERPFASPAIGAVLLADTALLTTLLYFSGGPWNPFTSLYLLYVMLAALALGMRWATAVVIVAAAGYALLFYAHIPVGVLEHEHHGGPGLSTHLKSMWVAFAVTGALVAYFVSRVAAALREREAQLAQAQRIAARNEKLVSLSTLAAGAAHELGTPLSTIAVAAKELERVLVLQGLPWSEDARLIRGAVERCRGIVLQMSGRSPEGLGEVRQQAGINAVVGELRERAVLDPPDRLAVEIHPQVPGKVAIPREGLVQALGFLVRNAMDASSPGAPIMLRVFLDDGRLRFEVEDSGSGIAAEILERLGEPFFTTKPTGEGMGLGVFLARAFAERWHGRLAIDSVAGRGTRATLEIPVGVES
jgi:two-component system sensor histidine kinase RegB